MANRKPLTDKDGEVRELTEEDFKHFRPIHEVLSPSLLKKIGIRGAQKSPTKQRITIRLSPEVVESFRATGSGWQTRVDVALKDWLKSHQLI